MVASDGAGLRIAQRSRIRLIPGRPLYFIGYSRTLRDARRAEARHALIVASMAETIRHPRCAFDLRGVSALAVYVALAALFFARGLGGRATTAYIGKGVDPPLE
jgi:hypothetical protein